MTLRDAILSALTYVDEDEDEAEPVIYAYVAQDSWTADTPCRLLNSEQTAGKVVVEDGGQQLFYFLEMSLTFEVIEGWQEISTGNEVTEDDIVRVVIYYARHDSWPQTAQSK